MKIRVTEITCRVLGLSVAAFLFCAGTGAAQTTDELPNAPVSTAAQQDVVAVAEASFRVTGDGAKRCGVFSAMKVVYIDPNRSKRMPRPCSALVYPYQRFLESEVVIPLSWQQKGYLALHELTDPTNLGTIVGISAITAAADSHSAYGPGWKGFGKLSGVSLLQDATGDFFGVFAIPSLVHQDPHYYRMPHAKVTRRILYSISRTAISRNDDGSAMPNYGTLLSYPIQAEIDNLYVPGIESDGPSTMKRIGVGLATDPIGNLLAEFLPDVASRVHIRIIFVQRILNRVAVTPDGVD